MSNKIDIKIQIISWVACQEELCSLEVVAIEPHTFMHLNILWCYIIMLHSYENYYLFSLTLLYRPQPLSCL